MQISNNVSTRDIKIIRIVETSSIATPKVAGKSTIQNAIKIPTIINQLWASIRKSNTRFSIVCSVICFDFKLYSVNISPNYNRNIHSFLCDIIFQLKKIRICSLFGLKPKINWDKHIYHTSHSLEVMKTVPLK